MEIKLRTDFLLFSISNSISFPYPINPLNMKNKKNGLDGDLKIFQITAIFAEAFAIVRVNV